MATGSVALQGAGSAPPDQQSAQPRPTTAIDYDTIHLEKRLAAVRASGAITLDGMLDEPSWSEAPMASGFIQNDPREGSPATYDTEVRVLYTDDALYFGVFARDDEPSKIIVSDLKKDYNTGASDGFRVVLDTFHDGRNAYQFATNPAGAKWDSQMANEGRDNNANWDGIWDVKARITETGWVAEIWIPFRALKFGDADPQVWGLNFERKLRRLNEDSYWSPIPRIYDAQRVSLAGTLEDMRGLHAGRNIRVKPYALTSGSRVSPIPGIDGEFQAGIDAKYGVTSGLVWDFTVNTDFSQVEADEQQVNLTRFSLFFPEKRDFFLENQGIFAFGQEAGGFGGGGGNFGAGRTNNVQDMRLFFTRTIGLSDTAQALPILAGTRLSGREGPYTMGILNIQQREDKELAAPATNFTALRLRRDVLANSDVGAIVLNKEVNGPEFNRMVGLDGNFRFGDLQLNAFSAKTVSPDSAVPPTGNDLASRAGFDYRNRTWRLNGRYTRVGNRFNDELGFVPRVGVNEMNGQINRTFRPGWLPRSIREFGPHWVISQFNRQEGGNLDQRIQDFHFPVNFADGSFVEGGVNTNLEVIRLPFTLNGARGAVIRPGQYEYNEYFVTYRPNDSAKFSSGLRFGTGEFYDGHKTSYGFGPTYRPNEQMNVSFTAQINDITLPDVSYVSTLLTTRLNYNFNTKVFVNALVQYSTDSHQLSSNVRFNVIHRPLSDIFFVYNEHRDEQTGLMQDRSIIAKMTYMMAF
jgi:hypothetical protein